MYAYREPLTISHRERERERERENQLADQDNLPSSGDGGSGWAFATVRCCAIYSLALHLKKVTLWNTPQAFNKIHMIKSSIMACCFILYNLAQMRKSDDQFLALSVLGGVQNSQWSNVERPIFRNFKITNMKIAKDELFYYFIYKFTFYYNFWVEVKI